MVGVQIASSGVFKNLYALFQGNRKQGTGRRPKGKASQQDRSPGPKLRAAVLYRCSGYRCVCHRGGSNAFGSGYHKHSRISEP